MSAPTEQQLLAWGKSLREIDPATLVPDEEGAQVRWFLGESATELFAWSHAEQPPHHLQLVFAHVSVEWSQRAGLSTGTFSRGAATAGGRYDTYLMHSGGRVDLDVCKAALVLLSASSVERPLVEPLLRTLEQVVDS
ncbi:MAG: hypothetical protein ACOZIN_20375 [Myxococcota bacterium]